jgi:hypothetical protein
MRRACGLVALLIERCACGVSATKSAHGVAVFSATLSYMPTDGRQRAALVATPWGKARVVEELSLSQRAGGRRFGSLVQLLETTPSGERLVRFAYTTDGSARRGPVTLRQRDLERLRAALERAPELKEVLLG